MHQTWQCWSVLTKRDSTLKVGVNPEILINREHHKFKTKMKWKYKYTFLGLLWVSESILISNISKIAKITFLVKNYFRKVKKIIDYVKIMFKLLENHVNTRFSVGFLCNIFENSDLTKCAKMWIFTKITFGHFLFEIFKTFMPKLKFWKEKITFLELCLNIILKQNCPSLPFSWVFPSGDVRGSTAAGGVLRPTTGGSRGGGINLESSVESSAS